MDCYPQEAYVFHDGRFIKAAEISLYSLGPALHLAGAAFEGIRAYNTHNGARLFKAEQHYLRLKNSCQTIGIAFPFEIDELIDQTYALLEKNNMRNAYVRPLVFSNPDFHFLSNQTSIVISAWEWGPFLGHQPLAVTLEKQSPAQFSLELMPVKFTGQYTKSLLALRQAKANGFDDALLLDPKGMVAQASSANLFMEKDSKLYTPPTDDVFPGITRQTVFEIAEHFRIPVVEQPISIEALKQADGAFLCGTATEIIGIKSIDRSEYGEDWSDTLGATIQRTYKNLVLEKENYEVII